MQRVALVHIPKTGGTTLHNLLIGHFRSDEVCPERFGALHLYSEAQLRAYRFFSGHCDLTGARRLPGDIVVLCLLRNPRERILSHYYYWRSHTWEHIERYDLEGPRFAKSVSLEEFLQHGGPAVDNAMTRAVAGHAAYAELDDAGRLARARQQLDTIDAIGICERMDESVRRIFARLGLPVPGEVPRDNSAEQLAGHPTIEPIVRGPVSAEAEQLIVQCTRLDRPLYQYALDRFDAEGGTSPAS